MSIGVGAALEKRVAFSRLYIDICTYTRSYGVAPTIDFEWDEAKNRENPLKHDVSFETAREVFNDPVSLT